MPISSGLRVQSADEFHDAFPFNENPALPGLAAFDTTSALVKTGRNTAQLTGDANRFDIPADTLVACHCDTAWRHDLVFRIKPGPGNYGVAGNRASGLRRVPTSPAVAVPGDGSFWGAYLADNGLFGTAGGHPGGTWSENVWNSARMDSAEYNLWPIEARGIDGGLDPCLWASMYDEQEPKFTILGIAKNRCWLITATAGLTSTNTMCGDPSVVTDSWPLAAGYVSENGLPLGQTYEYTKILPDGLFTPGTHVQYFIRAQDLHDAAHVLMTPDSSRVTPQVDEIGTGGVCATTTPMGLDAHRWQQFGVLPDRWKAPAYGGLGMACMLVVDNDDGRGDEYSWVIAADQMGATGPAKYGAHNGWHVSDPDDDPNDPANFVHHHGGQAGTTWDLYNVRGVDDLINGYAGSIGSRLCFPATGYATGKNARIGPTPIMLQTYYPIVYLMSGQQDAGVLGPRVDGSQDDVSILDGFAQAAMIGSPKGLFAQGSGFAESEDVSHTFLLNSIFGAGLVDGDYSTWAPNPATCVDLHLQPPHTTTLLPAVESAGAPAIDNDVLTPLLSGSVAAGYGSPSAPASIHHASTISEPWVALVSGWDLKNQRSQFCPPNNKGRAPYLYDLFPQFFGSICDVVGSPGGTLSAGESSPAFIPRLSLEKNPVMGGRVFLQLSLPSDQHVEVGVFDLSGRKLRTIADRSFGRGLHELEWSGHGEDGSPVRAGIYFIRARLAGGASIPVERVVLLR